MKLLLLLFLVPIADSALSQIQQKHGQKANTHTTAKDGRQTLLANTDAKQRFFETKIAPLLAEHCLECHDPATQAGGLNLTTKRTAFAKSDSGITLVSKSAANSRLWAAVANDTMPLNRPALSAAEKADLKKWINDGAIWTLNEIDPAVYVHRTVPAFVQRLTLDEYIRTVRTVTGVDIDTEARELLPADLRADGFSNTAYSLNTDLTHVAAYAELAHRIVSRMDVPQFVRRFSKRRRLTDQDLQHVIQNVGHWVLRGPVSRREVIAYRGIATTTASNGGTFEEAMQLMLEAMLQSPRFLYRIEQGHSPTGYVNEYELAARLSYVIWGTAPDEELLSDAKAGDLSDRIPQQLDRMLDDDQARQQMLWFFSDWLDLDRLKNLTPDLQKFPQWTPELAADMRQETMKFIEDIVWVRGLPLHRLLNEKRVFASIRLAQFYGLDPDIVEPSEDLLIFTKDATGPRGGLLTQGSLLTIGGDNASTVTRGLFLLHELLRGVVKDPPPCVDTTPVEEKSGLAKRDIALQRIHHPSCGGCHSKFEPLAFGLEKFNGLGQHCETDEHGNRLHDHGEILIPGQSTAFRFANSSEMMDILANSKRVQLSFTWKVTQFAVGRPLTATDAATVGRIHRVSQQNGGTWKALISAIVQSELIRSIR